MWWLKAVTLLFLAAALPGCGFQPLYGETERNGRVVRTEQLLSAVEIERISNRQGQILHNFLLDRLNPRGEPRSPTYRLTSDISVSTKSLGIQSDATTTRAKLTVTGKFNLQNIKSKKAVSFSIRRSAGYSKTETNYATQVAEDDALERSLRAIANDVRLQVGAHLKNGTI